MLERIRLGWKCLREANALAYYCPLSAKKKTFCSIDTSGLYYKNITIVNDTPRVISERCHNLEHHLWLSFMLLESSIMLLVSSVMLLESSIIPLENIYYTSITHDYCHTTFVVQSTCVNVVKLLFLFH